MKLLTLIRCTDVWKVFHLILEHRMCLNKQLVVVWMDSYYIAVKCTHIPGGNLLITVIVNYLSKRLWNMQSALQRLHLDQTLNISVSQSFSHPYGQKREVD